MLRRIIPLLLVLLLAGCATPRGAGFASPVADPGAPGPVMLLVTDVVRGGDVPTMTIVCTVDNGQDAAVSMRITFETDLLHDVDGDGDVDLLDFRALLKEFTGP